jgi:adenosine deaminase
VRAVEDREVLTRLGAEDVACDVCITSNVALGIVQAVDAHPLPQLIDAGVPVTLGADDSLMFGAGIADEYALAREVFELDDETLAAIARTSVTASGADAATKARLLAEIDDWLAAPPSDDAAPGHAAPGDSAQARA